MTAADPVVQALLSAAGAEQPGGASMDTEGRLRQTALPWAARHQRAEIMALLRDCATQ